MKNLFLTILLLLPISGICQLSQLPISTTTGIADSIVKISLFKKEDTTWTFQYANTLHYSFDKRGRLKSMDAGFFRYKYKYKKGLPAFAKVSYISKRSSKGKMVYKLNESGQIVFISHYSRSKNSWEFMGYEEITYDTLNRIESFNFTVSSESSLHTGYLHTARYTYDSKGRIDTEIWNYKRIEYFYSDKNGFRTAIEEDNEFGNKEESKSVVTDIKTN